MSNTYIVIIEPSVVLAVLQVLQDNKGTATKEEINMIMDIAEKNKDGWDTFILHLCETTNKYKLPVHFPKPIWSDTSLPLCVN